jgi:predicted acetyltransferase
MPPIFRYWGIKINENTHTRARVRVLNESLEIILERSRSIRTHTIYMLEIHYVNSFWTAMSNISHK